MIKALLKGIICSSLMLTLAATSVSALPKESTTPTAKSTNSHIIFNGVSISSSDATKYKAALAQVRHTVVESDGETYGYANKVDADKHIERLNEEPRVQFMPPHDRSKFYDLINLGGDVLEVRQGNHSTDLGVWSDKISSVKVTTGYNGLRLFEHENYHGSSIYLQKDKTYSNLGDHFLWPNKTWDNQASSLQFQ